MNTLLLFDETPPDSEEAGCLAALAAQRGDVVVLCCIPMNSEAHDIAPSWDRALDPIRQAAKEHGRRLECSFRFERCKTALENRMSRGDIDLLIVIGKRFHFGIPPWAAWRGAGCAVLELPPATVKHWNWNN